MRRRKQRKRIIIILCSLLLLMIVAYATFQTKIKVTGNTEVTSNWNIRATNVKKENKIVSGERTNFLIANMEVDLYEKGDGFK